MITLALSSPRQTEQLGAVLWHSLSASGLVFLQGELGMGKTTLVRGVLRAAGYTGTVKSPTYTLVEEYHLPEKNIYHFDLYRLHDPEELEWIGMEEYLQQNSLCLIEWPEMGNGFLPRADLSIQLQAIDSSRQANLETDADTLQKNILLNWKNKDILL